MAYHDGATGQAGIAEFRPHAVISDAAAILPVLDELAQVPAAMIVGHEPSLSGVIATLCGAGPDSVQLKKAGCAALDVPYDDFGHRATAPAAMLWLTTPRLLLDRNRG